MGLVGVLMILFLRPPSVPSFSLLLAGFYVLGASGYWGSFALNLLCDLISVRLARLWAGEAGMLGAGSRASSWVIAFCPFLLAYGPYPTTENLSIMLFLAASFLTFRLGKRVAKKGKESKWPALLGGVFWGLLALCRSYFLLFPSMLFVLPSSPRWRRRSVALLMLFGLIAPSVWVARNYVAFGKPAFSQNATVGWQSYQGICIANFDWWNQEDVQKFLTHPILSRMMSSYCSTDEDIASLDRLVRDEVIEQCVLEHPAQAAFNVADKGLMLFINWGQVLPYTRIPAKIRLPVNWLMVFYWWCVLAVWVRKYFEDKRRRTKVDPVAFRYGLEGIVYVVAVTLPFSVDARYLLGPFLIMLMATLEAAGGPLGAIRAGLPSFSRSSRRVFRTL